MNERETQAMSGMIFDESTEITIVELCEVCSVDMQLIDALIEEGILEPIGDRSEERRFTHSSVRRTRTAIHLQRDLGVNLPGAALALELLEKVAELRAQLRRS